MSGLSIQSHFGNGLVNLAKPAQRDDSSLTGSCSCPYPAILDGIPGQIPSYRLYFPPHHTGDCQAADIGERCHLNT